MPELLGELGALLDSALETLFAHRQVVPGLAQCLPQRAKGVPVEGLRRNLSLSRVEVARRRRAVELLPQLAQDAEQLVARGEAPGHQARLALGRVPASEMLDHGLRMDRRLLVASELAHRRGSSQALGAGTQ